MKVRKILAITVPVALVSVCAGFTAVVISALNALGKEVEWPESERNRENE